MGDPFVRSFWDACALLSRPFSTWLCVGSTLLGIGSIITSKYIGSMISDSYVCSMIAGSYSGAFILSFAGSIGNIVTYCISGSFFIIALISGIWSYTIKDKSWNDKYH